MKRIIFLGIAAVTAAGVWTGSASAQATAPAAPPPCAAAEHRQFDFWVGHWDVYDRKTNKKVAESLIESVYEGCGIRENWMPRKGPGGSLNIYLPATGHWHQSWIDSGGTRGEFVGGWDGHAMVLEGDWPSPPDPRSPSRTHMTYTPMADGSVLQEGLVSTDNGKTWGPSFALIYRRKPEGQ